MLSLSEQEKVLFYKLSKSEDGEVLKGYLNKILVHISDVSTLTADVVTSRQAVAHILKSDLVSLLNDTEVEPEEPESYE